MTANPVNNFNSSVPAPSGIEDGQSDVQSLASEISGLQARLQEMSGASETKHVGPSPTTILPPNPSPRPPFPFPDIWIQIILRRIMELIRMLLELLQRRNFGDDPPIHILRDKAPTTEETPPPTLQTQTPTAKETPSPTLQIQTLLGEDETSPVE